MSGELQTNLGYTFERHGLLRNAVTHTSFAHEQKLNPLDSNERLEFLGDAVIELCISDMLYHKYPDLAEGELTRKRASLVCESSLAALARSIKLGKFLLLGQGEAREGGREKDSILSDAFESVIGAMYLDGGMEETLHVIKRLFEPLLDAPQEKDSKSTLQEILQKNGDETATYEIISEEGPPHQRIFTANAIHKGKVLGTGTGTSKKAAEQEAAYMALKSLR